MSAVSMPPYTYLKIIKEQFIPQYEIPKKTAYKTVYITEEEFNEISKKIVITGSENNEKKGIYKTFGEFDITILLSIRRDKKINEIL